MASHGQKTEQPEEEGDRWKRQALNILEMQLARYPFIVQMRAVWRQLQDERGIWPSLIPLLIIVFVATYRKERRALREH